MKLLPPRLGTYFGPAFLAYAGTLLPFVAAASAGSGALWRLAALVASAMLAFAAACGVCAIVLAARWRRQGAVPSALPEFYWFCLANAIAATVMLALGAVLAIAVLSVYSGAHMLSASLSIRALLSHA